MAALWETALLYREQRRGFELALLLGLGLVLYGQILVARDDKFMSRGRGCIVSALGAVLWYTAYCTSRPPRNDPTRSRPLVVCLGDSLTHGQCSASVVGRIVPQLKSRSKTTTADIGIVNAGQNNICSWTVYHKRLQGILKKYDPHYVLLWIGTNDVRAIYSKWWSRQLEYMWRLPEPPSLQQFETNVRGIVEILLSHSPHLQVGLCTLPPMGEVLTDPANLFVKQSNAALADIATYSTGNRCTVIPVHNELESAILQNTLSGWKPPVDYFLPLSIVMGLLYHVVGFSWNQLSRLVGNTVLSDSLHLNETGADIVAIAIVEWLGDKGIADYGSTTMSKKTR